MDQECVGSFCSLYFFSVDIFTSKLSYKNKSQPEQYEPHRTYFSSVNLTPPERMLNI